MAHWNITLSKLCCRWNATWVKAIQQTELLWIVGCRVYGWRDTWVVYGAQEPRRGEDGLPAATCHVLCRLLPRTVRKSHLVPPWGSSILTVMLICLLNKACWWSNALIRKGDAWICDEQMISLAFIASPRLDDLGQRARMPDDDDNLYLWYSLPLCSPYTLPSSGSYYWQMRSESEQVKWADAFCCLCSWWGVERPASHLATRSSLFCIPRERKREGWGEM